MADPGFPRGGGTNSPGGAPTYDFAKFSQKLHEIERIWTLGGVSPKFYYVDPPLTTIVKPSKNFLTSSKKGKLLNILQGDLHQKTQIRDVTHVR